MIRALPILFLGAVGAVLWWWYRRTSQSGDGVPVQITGGSVTVANVEAVEEVQVFEYNGPRLTADYWRKGAKSLRVDMEPKELWYSIPPTPSGFLKRAGGNLIAADQSTDPWRAWFDPMILTAANADVRGVRSANEVNAWVSA